MTPDFVDGSGDGSVRWDRSSRSADWRSEESDCPGEGELWHDPTRLGRQPVQGLLSFTHLHIYNWHKSLIYCTYRMSGLEGKIETNAAIGQNRQEANGQVAIGCDTMQDIRPAHLGS